MALLRSVREQDSIIKLTLKAGEKNGRNASRAGASYSMAKAESFSNATERFGNLQFTIPSTQSDNFL